MEMRRINSVLRIAEIPALQTAHILNYRPFTQGLGGTGARAFSMNGFS